MIDRQFNRITIQCDSCDDVFVGDSGEEWDDVWSAAKREGWKSKKIGDEWVHGCPRCGVD